VLTQQPVVVVNCPRPERVCAAVVNLLPPALRLQLSFTTGLLPAGQRPFKLHVLPTSASGMLRSTWLQQSTMIDFNEPGSPAAHPWAVALQEVLQRSETRRLSRVLEQDTSCEDLIYLAALLTPAAAH